MKYVDNLTFMSYTEITAIKNFYQQYDYNIIAEKIQDWSVIFMNIKVELMALNKRQLDLILELNRRSLGYTVTTTDVSCALKGLQRPKYDKIRSDSETIINEWKAAASP